MIKVEISQDLIVYLKSKRYLFIYKAQNCMLINWSPINHHFYFSIFEIKLLLKFNKHFQSEEFSLQAKFQAEFENMKYSGEAKLSSGQRILEDMQAKLEECDSSSTDSRLKLERMDRILLNVKAGIEHLSDKLISLKLVSNDMSLSVYVAGNSRPTALQCSRLCCQQNLRYIVE